MPVPTTSRLVRVWLLVVVALTAVGCLRRAPQPTPTAEPYPEPLPTVATPAYLPPPPTVVVRTPTATVAPTPVTAPPSAALPAVAWLPVIIAPPLTLALPTTAPSTVAPPILPQATAGATPTPQPTVGLCLAPGPPPPETAPPFVGLHASADPQITAAERCTFFELRPSLIKVLTFHPPTDIADLAASQPHARWIVRVFLEFGGRAIDPEQFVRDTLSDTQRTLAVLADRPVVVEIHNEPNLIAEGLGTAWSDGRDFANWWLTVLADYRAALPTAVFLYPGLSPGADVPGVREGHIRFLEQSRAAVEAADGLGVHLYWSQDHPLADGLAMLDDVIARFPEKPIWITEASYNQGGITDGERAEAYRALIAALKLRPTVQGVTFFVASAADPAFADETWVGRPLARLLGER